MLSLEYSPGHKAYDLESDNVGFIAQEVKKVLPEIVYEYEGDLHYRLQYGLMVTLGIASIQEQQKRIDALLERINNLNDKLSA